VPFSPTFEGPIEGYVMNFIHAHQWRAQRDYNRDDLRQESYLVYMRVCSKYPDLEGPAHFMALFKSAWFNHFTNLANKDTQARFMVQPAVHQAADGDTYVADVSGDRDNDGYLAVLLKQAPREISMVLALFLNAPQEMLDVVLGSWNGRDKRCRSGGSRKVCQALGIPEDRDVLKAVEEYFKHS
jgi:hypothetical protein